MKIIYFATGIGISWVGIEIISSGNSVVPGWILLLVGVLTVVYSFFASENRPANRGGSDGSGSGPHHYYDSSNDSGGDGGGGGGD
ncbi:hypothetical protein [Vibrio penaeicida]|uniref:Methanol dehydrogenase n=1 Tax=Vibrio penaeicida TaxID=104609 RepID=A0AAV5P0I6_9VIBR|nr:hypothetical protein [Vibrio penaeicida]GLQ76113.1 hypothetical protein GCM10007932_54760 [Vibrio penaeicida]